jgi:hypothetical protein
MSGAHPTLYSVGTMGAFLMGKAMGGGGHKAENSPPSRSDVKKVWRSTSTPICLHGFHRDNLGPLNVKYVVWFISLSIYCRENCLK